MKFRFNNGVKKLILPHWGKIVGISLLEIACSALQVTFAVVVKYLIDTALFGGDLQFWGLVLAANLSAIILFYLLANWCSGNYIDKLTAKLRYDLLHAAVYSRDAKLQQYHSGEMLSRGIEDVNTVSVGAMSTFPALIGQITRLVGSFIAVAIMQPVVAIILLVMAIVMGGIAGSLRPAFKKRQRKVREAEEKVSSNMQEDFQQLELIQSLQAGKQVQNRFYAHLKNSLKAKFRSRCWSVGVSSAIASASYIGTGAVLLWGTSQLVVGAMTYGDLTSVLELLSLFRGPVLAISGQWSRLLSVEVACERLMDMLELEDTDEVTAPKEIDTVESVVFENVTFRYPGEETAVVENFNATFPLTGWTCLTGISGKGKTTLFKLVLGLYTPQQGRVYLKTGAEEITCSEQTRHLFAYVPQDYAMLSGTVLENLQLAAPDVTEEAYIKALELADAGFVLETAAGIQTHLGENNTGLSKGQLQRLAIARAIVMDRRIFLLDECTSALDAQTEDTVLHNLKKLNKSAILVTHRPQAVEELENVTFVPMDQ